MTTIIPTEEKLVNRDFKGIWIPREIWLRKDINALEKILWAEIHSLYDREKGGCYASNEYLAQFVGVQDRRLRDMIYNLRDKGLIKNVSFDGRIRIIKAVLPPEDYEDCQPDWQEVATQTGNKLPPSMAESCHPHIYIDNKAYNKEDTSLKVPTPPDMPEVKTPIAAGAAPPPIGGSDKHSSSSKTKKIKAEFSPEVLELTERIIEALKGHNAVYRPPANLMPLHVTADFILRIDKRDLEEVITVVRWALTDPFWCDQLYTKNPLKTLREKFERLYKKMKAPPPKNPYKIDRRLRDENGEVVDKWKDDLF